MNLDQIEDLLRRYLSAGIAVVVVLVSPLTGGTGATGPVEVGATQAGQASVPDGQVDILDGTPPGAEPDGVGPDPVPDTPGPDVPGPDTGSADTGADPTGNDSTETGTADPDTAAEAGSGTDGAADSGAETGSGADATAGADAGADAGSGADSDDPGSAVAPSTDPGAADLADRGPADRDEPGVSDGDPRPSEGAPTTGGTGDRPGSGTGSADPDSADPESAAPTTGAGPADDGPSGTATPTTGAAPEEAGAAAERYGWGTPVLSEDFTSTRLTGWTPYEGPGYDGRGRRSPEAIGVRDGILTITGDEQGTTGGLCWGGGQRYGRWEARLRAPASDVSYNALLLLWPDADDAPVGGEVDVVEMVDPARRSADFYLHFGEDDDQIRSRVEVDGTAWHDWAVEWTPERIVGYVDGEEWFSSTDPDTFPPGPMHLCIQLDWFPQGTGEVRESRMEVDRVRQYALDGSGGGGLLDRMLSWS